MLFVLSAPSGAGKSTIARRMLALFPELRFSVSATTRPRRPREREGVDYHFLTRAEFARRADAGEFVEWEEIFGNLYGTLRAEVDRRIASGEHLLFDIDVKGAISIQRIYPAHAVLVFIDPPDLETLRVRLERRGSDIPDIVDRRIARAAMERDSMGAFDHVVVNDDLARAVPAVADIIRDHIARASRTPDTNDSHTA